MNKPIHDRSRRAVLGTSLTCALALTLTLACDDSESPTTSADATATAGTPATGNVAGVSAEPAASGAGATAPRAGSTAAAPSAGTTAVRPNAGAPADATTAGASGPAGGAAAGAPPPASTAGALAAGSGGAPGEAGTAAQAGGAAPPMDLGMGDGSDVIALGDSWMAGIARPLNNVSGQPYRNYSAGGAPLLEGGGGRGSIPQQYARAKMENPDIKTVVLTAGGIDLTGGTSNDVIEMALAELMAEFGQDGVRDIVYFSYSRGTSESVQETFIAMQTKVCAAVTPARCHFIDSDTVINRMLADGIHPTQQGSMDLAEKAYMLMMEKGMRR